MFLTAEPIDEHAFKSSYIDDNTPFADFSKFPEFGDEMLSPKVELTVKDDAYGSQKVSWDRLKNVFYLLNRFILNCRIRSAFHAVSYKRNGPRRVCLFVSVARRCSSRNKSICVMWLRAAVRYMSTTTSATSVPCPSWASKIYRSTSNCIARISSSAISTVASTLTTLPIASHTSTCNMTTIALCAT